MTAADDAWASIAAWAGAGMVVAAVTIWLGGRFLNVRLRPVRVAASFVIGGLLGYTLLGVFVVRDVWHWHYGVIFLAFTVLSVLATLAGLEMLLGRARSFRPLSMGRAATERLRDARRYVEISRIIAQHGLAGVFRGRQDAVGRDAVLGRALASALEQAGTTFVKVGQVFAARTDLLSDPFRRELARLHDNVGPIPSTEVRAVILDELGEAGQALASSIVDQPIAAASIAQVHAARLADGTTVAVKVQRPGIRAQIERDLVILDRLACRLEGTARWAKDAGLTAFVDSFGRALRDELDFTVEAANRAAISAAIPSGGPVRAVRVYPELSGERVLVMEYVRGLPLTETSPGLDPSQRRSLARGLLDELLRQILDDGLFHADPHPGNVLLEQAHTLVLLDFGSVGRLDQQSRSALLTALLAVDRQNPSLLADSLLSLCLNPGDIDRATLETGLRLYLQRHLGQHQELDVTAVQGIFEIAAAHDVTLTPELGAVMRAIAVLDGTLKHLDPTFDLLAEAKRALGTRAIPTARGIRDQLASEAMSLLPVLRRLPRHADQLARSLENGRISVRTRILADPEDRRYIEGLLHLSLMTVLVVASGLMGVALLAIPGGPTILPRVELYDVMGFGLLFAGSILLLRVLVSFASKKDKP